MNTRILGGNPIREKTTVAVVSVFNIYYNENILQLCTGADSYQHIGTHLQKATTFSHLLASPGRELQPPAFIYQLLLEGSYYPLTEGFDPQHHCIPRFINFKLDQTASTQPFTYQQSYLAHCFKQNSETTITRISDITQTSE